MPLRCTLPADVRALTQTTGFAVDTSGMRTRSCILAAGTSLLLAVSAAAAEPDTPDSAGPEAPLRDPVSRFGRAEPVHPRFHWGIPVSPFPELEAERKIFGFHLEFEFGHSQTRPRQGYRLR